MGIGNLSFNRAGRSVISERSVPPHPPPPPRGLHPPAGSSSRCARPFIKSHSRARPFSSHIWHVSYHGPTPTRLHLRGVLLAPRSPSLGNNPSFLRVSCTCGAARTPRPSTPDTFLWRILVWYVRRHLVRRTLCTLRGKLSDASASLLYLLSF